ncbi:MAG: hypothetical protein HZA79_13005 [Sphingobacteriales bacterium]|nr:hypothetical protein [Sphingobacteriales bacterium]
MKPVLLLWLLLLPDLLLPQGAVAVQKTADSLQPARSGASGNPVSPGYKPEIFTSGFIDIINSGQVNASARFIRLFIGEPGKFALPLSFYSGVSSNNFQHLQPGIQQSNEVLVTNFINPLSGIANLSVDGVIFLTRKKEKLTKMGLLYHLGERVLSGVRTGEITDPQTGKPVNFLNSFGSLGLYLQTGAWERSNNKNLGVSWLAWRYIGCYTNPSQLKEFMPGIRTNGSYTGYSIAWGVEITRLVNIRVVYYKYTKKPEIDYYRPIYQFSFNYSLK